MAHRVLFVCVGNSCRSQMAEAFARRLGLDASSAGTMPAHEISRGALLAMGEEGIAMGGAVPKALDFRHLSDFERIVCMGPGVAATCPDLHFHEDWGIDDPVNLGLAVYRRVRDEIGVKVQALADEIRAWTQEGSAEAAAHA